MRDVRALPKANLHLHLTGAMRPATLAELAARAGRTVPPPLVPDAVHDWSAFQARYDAARDMIRDAEDVARVVTEAAADDAADGCGWLEIQVDPTAYVGRLGGGEAVVEAVLAGAARSPIPVGVIVAASWAGSPDGAHRLARLAARYAGRGVVGFGLSNDERRGRVADFAPACRAAAEAGLTVAPHAGFYEPAAHVRDCVRLLGARRIGHGLTAAADPVTLDLLAECGATVELCPTSYPPLGVVPGLAAVPLRGLLAAGVPVALGTDDPLLFGTGLAGQYAIARDLLGRVDEERAHDERAHDERADAELAALARHSVTASAAPPAVRARLLAGIDAWLAARPPPPRADHDVTDAPRPARRLTS
jgi:adenosine deaminase